MSTDAGDASVAKAAVDQAQQLLAEEVAKEEQLSLLDPLTADEIHEAREAMGAGAGMITVLQEARKRRAGRPKGVRNKRTDDFARYIAQFGQDPAITLMQIQSTPTEDLVMRSRLLDPPKRQMSVGDAESLRIRCAEALMPYIHSKKPVAVDATIRGIMVVEEIGGAPRSAGTVIDAEPLGVLAFDETDDRA